ncbi:MAG: hypothetical protein IJ667_04005 [Synergistaceae bacterium]|nr:hypothetical protein [Synergistaceae bacterium]
MIIKNFKKLKKRGGESLIEILISLAIIGLILPELFFMPSGILKSIIELRRSDAQHYAAKYWLSRLPDANNISYAKLQAMPTQTPDGKIKFNLISCNKINNNSFKIILEIKDIKSNKIFTLEAVI